MRIQHNIPAMNSLVNYTRNNNALAKNLEKLSSGYRINSAADDAAGLAISEKMRSQIAGLEKAYDNANDGISLVQVAEGALTEVNSMLTRLTELATQSANGTFEDEVDRVNIQEETNAILEEIDRISKATNFNGINLLDGSMSSSGKVGKSTEFKIPTDVGALQADLGTKTILHASAADPAATKFSIDLNDYNFTNKNTESLTIKLGTGEVLTFTQDGNTAVNGKTSGTKVTGEDIAKSIAAADGTGNATAGWTITDDTGAAATATGLTAGTASIGGQNFKITADGSKITFEQLAVPKDGNEVVPGDMSVEITGAGSASAVGGTAADTVLASDPGNKVMGTLLTDTDKIKEMADAVGASDGNVVIHFDTTDNTDVKVQLKIGNKVLAENSNTIAMNNAGALASSKDVTFEGQGDAAGIDLAQITSFITNGGNSFALTDFATDIDTGLTYTAAGNAESGGSYNVSTVDITNGTAGGKNTLASTVIDLADMGAVADGASVKIGETTYVFQTGSEAPKTSGDNSKIVDISDIDPTNLSDVATKLTEAAKDNSAFSVGHDDLTSSKLTIVEKKDQDIYKADELDSVEDIKAKFSYQGFTPATGKSLTLQIGDTNADYQHVSVDVADMSSKGLGIDGLNLSNQKSAGEAIATIKNAVNTVSMQRGKLGALQNRLDHTLNNLETTTTNISASESQIRDVNMAKEMTAYTKNNILAQAAQSMLAQANSMPQGVLQLLQ